MQAIGEPIVIRSSEPRSAPASHSSALWWLLRGLALGAGGTALLYVLSDLFTHPLWIEAVVAALFVTVVVLVVLQLRYRSVLAQLNLKVLEAQEGVLEPLQAGEVRDRFLAGFVDDYNAMITTLHTLFSTVEECQGRILNERNKINAILQSLPGALFSVDDNLRVVSLNRQTEEMFATTPDKLLGRILFDLLEFTAEDRDLLRDAFLYKRPIRNQELQTRVDGNTRWLSLNLSFLNEQGSDMAAVITLQDITEYKQLQDSVAYREKLVAMGQLAAGVAHELNTPLGNILGYAQLLQEGLADGEKIGQYTRIISDETRRCSKIVHDLLNYARKDQCAGEICDVNTLVREVVETFISCRAKRYGVDMRLHLAEGELIAEGACGQLDIVLTNLILNALQAVQGVPAPRIDLATTATDEAGYIRLTVTDNGPGVPPENRSRIFDPFFTTKDVGEGTGLGLSISQAMLNKHGASIRYDADYPGGARFVVKLPAVRQEDVIDAVRSRAG